MLSGVGGEPRLGGKGKSDGKEGKAQCAQFRGTISNLSRWSASEGGRNGESSRKEIAGWGGGGHGLRSTHREDLNSKRRAGGSLVGQKSRTSRIR